MMALATLLFVGVAFGAEPTPVPLLWRAIPPPSIADQPPLPKKPWIVRERYIAFDETLLRILKDAAARPHPPVAAELFDAGRYELDIVSTLARINDTSFIRGQFKPPAQGDFSLVINGAMVTGTFQPGRRIFKIEPLGNGHHRVIEIDPEQEPKE
ncbi:MAG: hypothetical protein LZF86_140099 [Nitrospira sp.]|nr:MAG: hypothetical protein LZF86_140099 [Nitrospira sp.]